MPHDKSQVHHAQEVTNQQSQPEPHLTPEENILETEDIFPFLMPDLPLEDTSDLHPSNPTEARPGSENKVQMLAARYAAGLPLWHDTDCRQRDSSEHEHEEGNEEDDEAFWEEMAQKKKWKKGGRPNQCKKLPRQ